MKRRLLKTLAAVLAIAAAAAGPVRGQNASPDVTLDFTTNDWGIPEGKANKAYDANSYTSGDYTITLQGGGGSSNGYYFNSGYLMLGKSGAYLELPEFESAVDSIVVVGKSGASAQVTQNIYVGGTAVSTQTTGAAGTNTYVINENYRAAGNIYTLKVDNAYNTQITYVKVYYVSSGGGSTPAVPHTVRFASGNDGWTVTDVDSARSATAPAVLQNVMAGDSLVVTAPATLPGKVKSVKAVKFVAPAATVTTAPTATEAYIAANSTTALVNAGAANGGTMMYAVTTTNAQPASTADFSATRPTAEGRAAGTYYVWYYAKADADHSDSEIAGPVSVTLAEVITWNSTNVLNSAHWNVELNQWNPNSLTYEGITISFSGEGSSSFTAYDNQAQSGSLICFGDEGDSFTFAAPSGKKFCKIEIINNGGFVFDEYGDWTMSEEEVNKAVWSGTAANAVTLGTVYTAANNLNSIVFTLIDD